MCLCDLIVPSSSVFPSSHPHHLTLSFFYYTPHSPFPSPTRPRTTHILITRTILYHSDQSPLDKRHKPALSIPIDSSRACRSVASLVRSEAWIFARLSTTLDAFRHRFRGLDLLILPRITNLLHPSFAASNKLPSPTSLFAVYHFTIAHSSLLFFLVSIKGLNTC